MNYAALNAKLSAIAAKPPNRNGHDAILQSATNICRFIHTKPQRDFVMAMAQAAHDKNLHVYIIHWKRLSQLDKHNHIVIKSILGAEIDLNNILWMYRLKRYHCVKGDATFGHLIPIRYMLSRKATRRMADCVTPKALLDEVASSPYALDFKSLADKGFEIQAGGPTPEQMLEKTILHRYQAAARRFPNSLAPALAYLKSII